ncbi:hypothetical protein CcaverHIS002_0105610 [Cutaneotrichosporon cavernicola]|uniref:Uncharacterized protein n=1 Tax=Cutaneotrichosporon cavernicola TaxID=279322 RepID=A0AA48IDM0_9TREE|nr:uncharacterized protein CcaverHIS019_0105560 [Cutaneotrichosporon cavernicola]BEI80032.1 hypothetical protein CcaverHIS002_0105610 [Cutaneotrichosporon cavernicola]BEI87838.1 hypothetical protein CcaverHIS019_0105560 [Cutaneotrichosporon cavernicola]BEI95612.1 hypothetical protein CcaverHIS631_0105610 [Cutaneotrichosporon cavernicola]BEJ03387.1 hypothetical protein CcaverHIS641_0105620 [Cutaneotrichosporon cavernicola]
MSFSHFIATASPPEVGGEIIRTGPVWYTFKPNSNGTHGTHMFSFHIADGPGFTISRADMINAHATLEKALATNWTSSTTLKNTITTTHKANRSPIFRHQCDLVANSDVLYKCLTDLRNGLSFLDKCEKLCVTPAVFVNTLSLQTILPYGRESRSTGPIAMWRGSFDIAHRMKNPHADDDLVKTPALVAKTNKLCAQPAPSPLGDGGVIELERRYKGRSSRESAILRPVTNTVKTTEVENYEDMRYRETPVNGCKQSCYPDNPKVSSYMNAHSGLCQHRCSGHHTPCARSPMSNRRGLLRTAIHVTRAATTLSNHHSSSQLANARDTSRSGRLPHHGERNRSVNEDKLNTMSAIDPVRPASDHRSPRSGAVAHTVRRPLQDGPAKAPDAVLDSPAIARLKIVNMGVNKPLPEIYDAPRSSQEALKSGRPFRATATACTDEWFCTPISFNRTHSDLSSGSSVIESRTPNLNAGPLHSQAVLGSLYTQLPMDSDRTPEIQDRNLATLTAVMERSAIKPSVVVRGASNKQCAIAGVLECIPGEGSIGTLKPTAGRHRMSPALKDSRCPTASQSGSTSPKSDRSYTTAATSTTQIKQDMATAPIAESNVESNYSYVTADDPVPRSQGGVAAEKDSKLVSEVPWIPSHPISRSPTVRAVVSDNRYLDNCDPGATTVCNMSQVLEPRSGTAMSAPNTSKDVRNSRVSVYGSKGSGTGRSTNTTCPTGLSTIRGHSSRNTYAESSGASCTSTLVPDKPWYELPKHFAPLSEVL